jgi:heme exporter protein A
MPDDPSVSHPARLTAIDLAASRGGRTLFQGLSFGLRAGELVAVTGPNGAGKSTLLRLIAGLARPSAGGIVIAPEEATGERLHYVGHLDGLKAALSVEQNLAFFARLWRAKAAAVDDAMEALAIGGLAHLGVAVLSAGQRRRTALARLLLARRPLWLLDEPSAALDAAGEVILGGLIARHLATGGMAVVATHMDLPLTPTRTISLGAA